MNYALSWKKLEAVIRVDTQGRIVRIKMIQRDRSKILL